MNILLALTFIFSTSFYVLSLQGSYVAAFVMFVLSFVSLLGVMYRDLALDHYSFGKKRSNVNVVK